MLDPISLTRRFVDIPSVTGEEGPMVEASAEVLRGLGFAVRALPVSDGRANVLATLESPRVMLCTHLDTVPPHFPAREDDTWVHGRGACDAKGILAAMLAAAEQLLREGVRDLALLLTVGEERSSDGAKQASATLQLPSVRYTIVGEPTESRFARTQKGGLGFRLRVQGKSAHSGYPESGRSAVLELLDLLRAVSAAEWGDDPELGRGTANIGVVQGGEAANIVPGSAQADIYVRIVDSIGAVRERIERIVARAKLPVTWSVHTQSEPQQLVTLPGEAETVVSFNTDVPHLTGFGRKLLVGPGSILVAHGPEERIAKAELQSAVDLYRRSVLRLRAMPD